MKNIYLAPEAEFLAIATNEDILEGSYNDPNLPDQGNYGGEISNPYS